MQASKLWCCSAFLLQLHLLLPFSSGAAQLAAEAPPSHSSSPDTNDAGDVYQLAELTGSLQPLHLPRFAQYAVSTD